MSSVLRIAVRSRNEAFKWRDRSILRRDEVMQAPPEFVFVRRFIFNFGEIELKCRGSSFDGILTLDAGAYVVGGIKQFQAELCR